MLPEHTLNAFIENRTYDEIQIGESAVLLRTLTPQDSLLAPCFGKHGQAAQVMDMPFNYLR